MIMMPYGWPWPITAVHRPGRLLAPHRLTVMPKLGTARLACLFLQGRMNIPVRTAVISDVARDDRASPIGPSPLDGQLDSMPDCNE